MIWRTGDKVGPYEIISQIGQGGMATVYKAYHRQLERYVAIKVLHALFLDNKDFIARFSREAQIVAQLEHPNIVPVYDYNEYERYPYLVMKLVEGQTLKEQLQGTLPDIEVTMKTLRSVADALTFAHSRGVLHRDVKPSNIIQEMRGTTYLTDFGLARMVAAGESTMSTDKILGTPHYMSPEQGLGQQDIDHRADIYSLGIVAYELFVGTVPFIGDTPFAIIHQHIYTPPPLPNELNPVLPVSIEQVLVRAIAKQPGERYNSANDFITDLEKARHSSQLIQLASDRSVIAERSMAERMTIVLKNLPTSSSTTLTSPSDPAAHTDGRWIYAGLGIFVALFFLCLVILFNASSTILELSALFTFSDPDQISRGSAIADLSAGFTDGFSGENIIGASVETDELLATFVTALNSDNSTSAIDALLMGLSLARETQIDYFVQATNLIRSTRNDLAVVAAVMALNRADTAETFDRIRAEMSQVIYASAGALTPSEFQQISQYINNHPRRPGQRFQAMDGGQLAQTRNLLANNAIRLATATLATQQQNSLVAEFHLLRAQRAMLAGDTELAREHLDAILVDDTAPDWTRTEAASLLEEIDLSS